MRILPARHSQKLSREAFERPSPHFAAATAQALAATVGSIGLKGMTDGSQTERKKPGL